MFPVGDNARYTAEFMLAEVQEKDSINILKMGYIARLPEAVFNSLRSSTILSDFSQIVEELVSNSIDAGSTKVHVSVDVDGSYIKVEDDGCGIRREDLTLLGERHATSKLHTLAELNAGIRTLGFRGEALSSLSDVALLEVTTRAHGNPNTYRKIIKGCKCLSLGLSGSKQGHGTTVIARDIFYSQPVRRRLFRSSQRKVLQSLRERILRIALIHPQVAFRVIDMDREEELIHTVTSTSPLCILSRIFGNELTSDLHEIDFSRGKLRLSGFLSSSPHLLSSKGLQFFYINSHFVDKTPIHKFLNNSSIRVESILDPLQSDLGRIKGGKEMPGKDSCERHSYPAYILNLSCPHSSYDITYELSKTMVEFKDWAPVISFVDEVIQDTWGKLFAGISQGTTEGTSRTSSSQVKTKPLPRKRKIWQQKDPIYSSHSKAEASKPSENDGSVPAIEECYKRRQRKVSEEPLMETADLQVKQKIENPPLSFFSFQNGRGITENNILCHPKDAQGFTQEISPSGPTSLFSEQTCKDEESNGHIGIEWANQAPGSDLGILDNIIQSKSKTLSGPFHVDHDEARSLFLLPSCSSEKLDVFSNHSPTAKISSAVMPPIFSNEKLLIGEDSFELENGEFTNAQDAYWSGKLDSSSNDGHSFSTKIFDSSLTPISYNRSPLTKKLKAHIWENGHFSICNEVDWLRTDEFLENDYLFSEDILQSKSPYSKLDSLEKNERNHLVRKRSIRLDHETKSFEDEYDQKPRNVEKIYLHANSDEFVKDSCHKLYFEDGLNSQQIKCRTHGREGRDVTERLKEAQIYEAQPDISLSKMRDFGSVDYQIDNFCLDHPPSTKSREMVPTVSFCSCSEDHYQNKLGFRYDMDVECQNFRKGSSKAVRRRSLSAPPFYKSPRKFGLHFNPLCSLSTVARNDQHYYGCDKPLGVSVPRNDMEAIQLSDLTMESLTMSDCQPGLESFFREIQESSCSEGDMQEKRRILGSFEQSEPLLLPDNMQSLPDNGDTMLTWRTDEVLPSPVPVSAIECPEVFPMASRLKEWNQSCIRHDCEDGILDVSSGALYLANSGLVPESMNKDCLMKANVLQQLDRKYIAVVAQGNLAVIDQHAADERIRLEQLRKEVLEGVGRQKVTVLEYEEELMLPLGGLQLLQNYSEQIEYWGWRYKIFSRNEASVKRKAHQLHRSSCKATLTAVPCILGVDLTAKDLSEYIRQLAQTDGSSAAPPAVLRILSFKACRGAIMFGDLLLPSECALLVDELKKTSLCFQCAHGRPTTVPLVNLKALHRELEKIGNSERVLQQSEITNGDGDVDKRPNKCWHGLQKHRANLERTKMRLN